MTFGQKLKQLRTQHGLSQEQLAGALTVSRQAISKWEMDASLPDIDKVILLSKRFGVSTDYLLLEDYEEQAGDDRSSVLQAQQSGVSRSAFRIGFGIAALAGGIFCALAALILAQWYAENMTMWYTEWGQFGTALLRTWRVVPLAVGVILACCGAAALIREYRQAK